MPRFPLELLEECNFAAKLLLKAARNQSKSNFMFNLNEFTVVPEVMSWSVIDYLAELSRRNKRCRGRNEQQERELLRLFPPPTSALVSAPCVAVDCEGRILVWYLPGLMGRKFQVHNSLHCLPDIDIWICRQKSGSHWRFWSPNWLSKRIAQIGGTTHSITTSRSIITNLVR